MFLGQPAEERCLRMECISAVSALAMKGSLGNIKQSENCKKIEARFISSIPSREVCQIKFSKIV
jgi:hypothetical protein